METENEEIAEEPEKELDAAIDEAIHNEDENN
jgi:hypothetical protein